jgi:hypothetical protein
MVERIGELEVLLVELEKAFTKFSSKMDALGGFVLNNFVNGFPLVGGQ